MSFPKRDGTPSITWGDLHALNAMVKPYEDERGRKVRPLDEARAHHRRWMERGLIGTLKPSEFMVLSAIVSRTFGWQKVIDTIPLSVFTKGLADKDEPDAHRFDEMGVPLFTGVSIDASTVRSALAKLAERHLIERFQVIGPERHTDAFMPISAAGMSYMLSEHVDWDRVPEPFRTCADARTEWGRIEQLMLAPWLKRHAEPQAEVA